MGKQMKVAAVNWELRVVQKKDDFFTHLHNVIEEGAKQGAELIVLPEYTIAELLSVVPEYSEREAPQKLLPFGKEYCSTLSELSKKHRVTIVGGSYFKEYKGGILNTCPISDPTGTITEQPKNCLVTYERETQKLSGFSGLHASTDPRLGVTICYDSEFPEAVRTLCEAGVTVLAVPSSTETIFGFNRVRYSCIARAIENQIFVIHSALVGSLGKEPHPTSYGSSAIIAPCMPQFPMSPLLAETELNKEGIAVAHLDLELLKAVRETGEVQNWKDRKNSAWKLS